VILGLYRLSAEVFGLSTYFPYKALGVTSMALVASTLYVLVRARLGAPVASAAALGVLLLPNISPTLSPWVAVNRRCRRRPGAPA